MHPFNQIHNLRFFSVTINILNLTLQILQKSLVIYMRHIFFSYRNESSKRRGMKFGFQNVAIDILINENKKTLSKLISIC